MSVIISQIKASLSESKQSVIEKALKSVGLAKGEVVSAELYKTSLDARNHSNIFFVHSVTVTLDSEQKEKAFAEKHGLIYAPPSRLNVVKGTRKKNGEIVIAGFGPAGMFCALTLAEYGYKPIVLERGASVDERVKKVSDFWQGGILDENTNVQFGEGGAGTFSDGKLTTRIKDPLCRYVLEQFVRFGAPPEILSKAKAHIGTDKLRDIVKAVRERITELGGCVRFNTKLDGLDFGDSCVSCAVAGDMCIKTDALVLAIGHSARDTFEMLLKNNISMEAKPFAVGARIEHSQKAVDESLYGKCCGNPLLPEGEYQMSYTQKDRQSCYTFCMCPGGFVVPSASETETVVVNGMSEYLRNGDNANAAVVVAVNKNDFGGGVLDGVRFAREIEQRAYRADKPYLAPATSVGEFLGNGSCAFSTSPTYYNGVYKADFEKILPSRVCTMMRKGLSVFAHRMNCFGDSGAVLTAPETRTSSPIRLLRNDDMRSIGLENLYPCGEGAGYAGGITSSAVDGVKVALQIMSELASD